MIRYILFSNEPVIFLMNGNRISRITKTGRLPAKVTGNAGRKKYHSPGFTVRKKKNIPVTSTREERNQILAARVELDI
jgi:hypothetical protein